MTALILHIVWSIAYLINSILFDLIKFFISKEEFEKLKQYNSNYFINSLLVLFFNKNLSFYKNMLNEKEIEKIEIERLKKWPSIGFIHSNINKIFKKKISKFSGLTFKQHYKLYKFFENNFNINNTLNTDLNNKINYSILNYIVKSNYSNFINLDFKDLFTTLLLSRNSISNDTIKISTYNLLKFNDYISYSNSTSLEKNFNKNQLVLKNDYNIIKFKHNLINYKSYFNFKNILEFSNNYFYLKNFNKHLNFNVEFKNNFFENLKKTYSISFSATNIVKYISNSSIKNSVILYLRKNKIFNKSRYSRNRQTYRTGAYWCLYVNIIAVVAFYFWFYKFTMNFGYLWWLLFSLIASFFVSRAIKHRFYNPVNIYNEFILGFKWLISILSSLFNIYSITNFLVNLFLSNFFVKIYQNKFFKDLNNLYLVKQPIYTINKINKFIINLI